MSVLVVMPMMKIGVMRVPVHNRSMLMPVRVRFSWRHVRPMRVLMVFVMRVPVLVLHRLVHMLMFVTFSQMQP